MLSVRGAPVSEPPRSVEVRDDLSEYAASYAALPYDARKAIQRFVAWTRRVYLQGEYGNFEAKAADRKIKIIHVTKHTLNADF